MSTLRVTQPEEVERFPLGTTEMHVYEDGSGDARGLVVFGETLPPNSDGPPAHVHHDDVELFHVLDGTLRVHSGTEWVDVAAGGIATIPPGTPHTYSNPHAVSVRYLGIASSSTIPQLFREVAAVGSADRARVAQLMAEHDSTIV